MGKHETLLKTHSIKLQKRAESMHIQESCAGNINLAFIFAFPVIGEIHEESNCAKHKKLRRTSTICKADTKSS